MGQGSIVVLAALLYSVPAAASARVEWFRQAGWGVFIHYLAKAPDLPVDDWNRLVDGFNTEGLARQLASTGAGYLILSIGQNSGHYLAPNKTYDELVAIQPSKCSRRDLVADMQRALAPRDIRLMVYLPAGAPDKDKGAVERLRWTRGAHPNREFQKNWERVIQEWSARWGTRVSGWWFDGCYWPNTMYRSAQAPNFASFAASARKGNPDSIVAFNRGVIVPIVSISEQEDYTAGETDEPQRIRYNEFWVDGAQFHMLSYLGRNWSAGPPRFSTSQVIEWTTRIVGQGGVVSWDVPTDMRGLIPAEFLEQLRETGKAVTSLRKK